MIQLKRHHDYTLPDARKALKKYYSAVDGSFLTETLKEEALVTLTEELSVVFNYPEGHLMDKRTVKKYIKNRLSGISERQNYQWNDPQALSCIVKYFEKKHGQSAGIIVDDNKMQSTLAHQLAIVFKIDELPLSTLTHKLMTPEMCSLQQLVIAKLNDLPPAEKKARLEVKVAEAIEEQNYLFRSANVINRKKRLRVTRRAILPEIEEFTVNLNGNFVNAVNAVVDFVSDREDPLATQHATASYAEIISQNTAVAISEEDLINELYVHSIEQDICAISVEDCNLLPASTMTAIPIENEENEISLQGREINHVMNSLLSIYEMSDNELEISREQYIIDENTTLTLKDVRSCRPEEDMTRKALDALFAAVREEILLVLGDQLNQTFAHLRREHNDN